MACGCLSWSVMIGLPQRILEHSGQDLCRARLVNKHQSGSIRVAEYLLHKCRDCFPRLFFIVEDRDGYGQWWIATRNLHYIAWIQPSLGGVEFAHGGGQQHQTRRSRKTKQ